MRKRLVSPNAAPDAAEEAAWLSLETSVEAEVTSEHSDFPLESALGILPGDGWKASGAGTQTIRLLFDHPLEIHRIHLEFCEEQRERTQEFALMWLEDGSKTFREIVRQQFNFNASSTRQIEDYNVNLNQVSALELTIIPDLSRREAYATLKRWHIA